MKTREKKLQHLLSECTSDNVIIHAHTRTRTHTHCDYVLNVPYFHINSIFIFNHFPFPECLFIDNSFAFAAVIDRSDARAKKWRKEEYLLKNAEIRTILFILSLNDNLQFISSNTLQICVYFVGISGMQYENGELPVSYSKYVDFLLETSSSSIRYVFFSPVSFVSLEPQIM